MGPAEMQRIAEIFNLVLENLDNDRELSRIKKEVSAMAKRFPVYPS
jgi:glycine/serine hydroxymethyltransferase